jgi:DNA-binding NarL/FixJ family response regulator
MSALMALVSETASAPISWPPEPPLSLLVADDHPVVLEGMLALFERQPDIYVVGMVRNGREAVDAYLQKRPDVGLIDLRMPVMDGMEAVRRIHEALPGARLIVISSSSSEEEIYRAIRAGVKGYLVKSAPTDELTECVRAVGRGGAWVPPAVGARLAQRIRNRELTLREEEVLHLVARGKSNKEIGAALQISESTVKVHVTHFLEKLSVTSRTEAIHAAIRRGLVYVGSNEAT